MREVGDIVSLPFGNPSIFSSHRQWMWWARLENLKQLQGSRHTQRRCCWPMGNGQNWPLRSFFPLPPFWKVLLSSGRTPTMTFKWPLETLGCNWFLAGHAACQGWILFQIFGGIVTSCCFVTKITLLNKDLYPQGHCLFIGCHSLELDQRVERIWESIVHSNTEPKRN